MENKYKDMNIKIYKIQELSVRCKNCLNEGNVKTMKDLMETPYSELLGFRNLGKKTLEEIRRFLMDNGLELKNYDIRAKKENYFYEMETMLNCFKIINVEKTKNGWAITIEGLNYKIRERSLLECYLEINRMKYYKYFEKNREILE